MTLRYEVVPGDGLVARYGDSILWVGAPLDPPAWEALDGILEIPPGTDPSGADTALRLTSLQHALDAHPRTVFAALIVTGDQAQGILRGPVTIRNVSDVAPATGHHQFAVTVPFPMSEAVYVGHQHSAGNRPELAAMLDLHAGVVPGAGAWVHPVADGHRHSAAADVPGLSSAAVPGSATPAGSTPVPLPAGQPAPSNGSAIGWPDTGGAPVTPPTGAHQAQPSALPPVDSSGSWASPAAATSTAGAASTGAASTGAASTGAAPSADDGPEPRLTEFQPAPDHERIDLRDASSAGGAAPLPPIDSIPGGPAQNQDIRGGAVVFDDGSTFSLDRDYVIGRRPEKDPRVQAGTAEALTVVDPDSVLSSAHALITRRGDQVLLRDLGSLNGTHIALPGATDWTRLEQHKEVPIVPGTRLLFGWTIATFTNP